MGSLKFSLKIRHFLPFCLYIAFAKWPFPIFIHLRYLQCKVLLRALFFSGQLFNKENLEQIICISKDKCAQYLWTWRQSVVPNDAPRDFGPEVAFGAKFQIPVARQGGREMSAPRPYVTDPFHPLGSICNNESFQYIYQSLLVISSMRYTKVFPGTVGI